jgi:cyclopropane-fatty-acyl-phospholipid synthase
VSTDIVAARPKIDAIRHHYEICNEFFHLMLGDSFTYSAGFYEEGEDDHADLARAQERKLDAFAELVGAGPGTRILDIGCGWGTALQRAVDHHGAERAVGLTLSRTQVEWIEGLGNPRIEVQAASWEDHEPPDPYDGIVCINAIEHFVRGGLPPREKLKRYRAFFRRCHALLQPGGRMALHMISIGRPPLGREVLRDMTSVIREEFEGSHVPYLHEMAAAVQGLFEVTLVRDDRLDCARSMRVWRERLLARRDEAVALESEEVVARFDRYLEVCTRMFGQGYFNDYRIGLSRIG